MTVIELINQLQDMPHNAQIKVELCCDNGSRTPLHFDLAALFVDEFASHLHRSRCEDELITNL